MYLCMTNRKAAMGTVTLELKVFSLLRYFVLEKSGNLLLVTGTKRSEENKIYFTLYFS